MDQTERLTFPPIPSTPRLSGKDIKTAEGPLLELGG